MHYPFLIYFPEGKERWAVWLDETVHHHFRSKKKAVRYLKRKTRQAVRAVAP